MSSEDTFPNFEPFARRVLRRRPDAIDRLKEILDESGMTMETIRAEALCARIREIERISALIVAAERRRNKTLREIERYRKGLGAALRKAIDKADAEATPLRVVKQAG
jgi:hypothetical protein